MKHNIIVSEAFCFPHLKERIGIKKIAVNGKGNIGAVLSVVSAHIGREPAFQPPSFIVVGPGTFFCKFVSGLKAVDEEIADITAGLGKIFYKLMKI